MSAYLTSEPGGSRTSPREPSLTAEGEDVIVVRYVVLLGESRLMSQAGWWQRDAGFQVGEEVQQSGGFPGAVALPW